MTTMKTTTMTTKVPYEKWSNITSGQTVKHYISSNIRSVNLVLTKCLAVHIDWQTPLVRLDIGSATWCRASHSRFSVVSQFAGFSVAFGRQGFLENISNFCACLNPRNIIVNCLFFQP